MATYHDVLSISPRLWPVVSEVAADVVGKTGKAYYCRIQRSLEFKIFCGHALMAHATRVTSGRSTWISLVQNEVEFGRIYIIWTPFGDKLALGAEVYRMPSLWQPQLMPLGLRFSRWGFTGLRSHRVEVYQESSTMTALVLLTYLHGRGIFVEGG